MGSGKRISLPGPGAAAPDFQLCRLEGGHASLADLIAGAPALLAFFKTSCPVCQLTLPFLDRLRDGASSSLNVVGVSQDEAGATREFNEQFGIRFPVLLDTAKAGYQASNAYGITHVPTLFLVERDGAISRSVEGFVKRDLEDLALRAGVAIFQPGENVPEWKAG
jgi:peroxiredoxin